MAVEKTGPPPKDVVDNKAKEGEGKKTLAERFPGVKPDFDKAREEAEDNPRKSLQDAADADVTTKRSVWQKIRAATSNRYAAQLEANESLERFSRREAEDRAKELGKSEYFLDEIEPPDFDKLTPLTPDPDVSVAGVMTDNKYNRTYYQVDSEMAQMTRPALEIFKQRYNGRFIKEESSEDRQVNRSVEELQMLGPIEISKRSNERRREPGRYDVDFKATDYRKDYSALVLRTQLIIDVNQPDLTRDNDRVGVMSYIIGQTQDGKYELVGEYDALHEEHGDGLPNEIQKRGYQKLATIFTHDHDMLMSGKTRDMQKVKKEEESQKRIFFEEKVPCTSPYSELEGYSTTITAEHRRPDLSGRRVFLSLNDPTEKQKSWDEVPVAVGDRNTNPEVIDAYTKMVAHACTELTRFYPSDGPHRISTLINRALYSGEERPVEPGVSFLANLRRVIDHDTRHFNSSPDVARLRDELFESLKAHEAELPVTEKIPNEPKEPVSDNLGKT